MTFANTEPAEEGHEVGRMVALSKGPVYVDTGARRRVYDNKAKNKS